MARLKIIKYGDPVLRKKTKQVEKIDSTVITLIKDMLETMYMAPGIGLAANQVGISLNVCVIDMRPNGNMEPLVLINPYIKEKKGRIFEEEGCLSLPGIYVKIPRWESLTVAAINEKGLPIEVRGEAVLARALQHELDHLAGKLLIDRVGLFKKIKIKNQIRILKKQSKWK